MVRAIVQKLVDASDWNIFVLVVALKKSRKTLAN